MKKFYSILLSISAILIGLISSVNTAEASLYDPFLGRTVGSYETEYGTLTTYYSDAGSFMVKLNGERADSFVALCIQNNAESAGENGVTYVENGQVVNWNALVENRHYNQAQLQYIALLNSLYSEKNSFINKNYPDAYGKNYASYVGYMLSDITEFYRLTGYYDMWQIKDQIFDANYYAVAYPDSVERLGDLGTNPDALYVDYLLKGQEEAKNASASFNINAYIAANPDLAYVQVDRYPLIRSVDQYYEHWITTGKAQNRIATVPEAVAAGYTGNNYPHDVSKYISLYMSKYY